MNGVPDTVHHKPSGLLSYLKRIGDLIAAHAIFAVGHHPHGAKPFVEWDSAVFEDGPDLNRKLLVASHALPHEARLQKRVFLSAALRTDRLPVWPLYRCHFLEAHHRVTVVPYRLHQTVEFADVDALHTSSIEELSW